MTLIRCPDCGAQVSSEAKACPKCARPVVSTSGKAVQTIEVTGKHWKWLQLVGTVLMLGGFFTFCALPAHGPGGGVLLGTLVVAFLGAVLLLWGRLGAWWYHG